MERFPRGSLPPYTWEVTPGPPPKVAPSPSTLERGQPAPAIVQTAQAPRGTCDLSMTCPTCSTLMQPEHAHYRCMTCGYRDSCCF